MNITTHFDQFFLLDYCRSETTIQQCQQLRYHVFCEEKGYFLDYNLNRKVESDEYDARSVHCLITHRNTKIPAATVRLVLADVENLNNLFPIEHFEVLRRLERDQMWRINRINLGEISRFSIASNFRRRPQEKGLEHGITNETFKEYSNERRNYGDLTLGLFKAIVTMSHEKNLTHWYAMMEPKLIRMLSRYGIQFNAVGPIFNYCGLRQPCIAIIDDLLHGIFQNKPDVWEFITSNGRYYGERTLTLDANSAY
ncbi:MAG: PEP-CTERM/exosortase system-associated acyltransferase [Gammaproteobacteria bacterium]|nr:PEP-CTERM/exosortase system-associated acyltransferase [Gammaproteobacteria bacterium]